MHNQRKIFAIISTMPTIHNSYVPSPLQQNDVTHRTYTDSLVPLCVCFNQCQFTELLLSRSDLLTIQSELRVALIFQLIVLCPQSWERCSTRLGSSPPALKRSRVAAYSLKMPLSLVDVVHEGTEVCLSHVSATLGYTHSSSPVLRMKVFAKVQAHLL